jgi:hypothetical protein
MAADRRGGGIVTSPTRERFAIRCLQEAMSTALPAYWRRRAVQFMEVDRSRPLPLNAPPEVVARASTAAQTALACNRHAWLLEHDGLPEYVLDEIADVLAEAAR